MIQFDSIERRGANHEIYLLFQSLLGFSNSARSWDTSSSLQYLSLGIGVEIAQMVLWCLHMELQIALKKRGLSVSGSRKMSLFWNTVHQIKGVWKTYVNKLLPDVGKLKVRADNVSNPPDSINNLIQQFMEHLYWALYLSGCPQVDVIVSLPC